MAKILITGAAGFIGSHLWRKLIAANEIVAIDNQCKFSNYEMKLARMAYIHSLPEFRKTKLVELDICDEAGLEMLFTRNQFDLVIHLAAMTGISQSIMQPDIYEKVNVRGFFNVLECCRKYEVKRLIFASSSSVYGATKEVPYKESAGTDSPLNLYAATKKMNELMAHSYASLYGMTCVGLRFFTVYGPWTRPDMATYLFIKNIIEGKPITLFDNGDIRRDFTFVDDIIEAISSLSDKMLKSSDSQNLPYQIYNIGAGRPITVRDYVRQIETGLNKKAIIINKPLHKGEMKETYADSLALYSYIGFRPSISTILGIEATIKWYHTLNHN